MNIEYAEPDSKQGLFLSVEGGDGSGKTTITKWMVEMICASGLEVLHLREPGGTIVGEEIRTTLIANRNAEAAPTPQAELLLYMASRMQLVERVIKPALARGVIVISERFMDSTFAMQGHARGMTAEVYALEESFLKDFGPSLTILLDIPLPLCLERIQARGDARDRFEREGEAFHSAVLAGFRYRAAAHKNRIRVIDASRPLEAVQMRIRDILVSKGLVPAVPLFQDIVI